MRCKIGLLKQNIISQDFITIISMSIQNKADYLQLSYDRDVNLIEFELSCENPNELRTFCNFMDLDFIILDEFNIVEEVIPISNCYINEIQLISRDRVKLRLEHGWPICEQTKNEKAYERINRRIPKSHIPTDCGGWESPRNFGHCN